MQMAEFHSFLWLSNISLCVGEWVGVWVAGSGVGENTYFIMIFCLNYLSIEVNGLLKSPIIMVLL